MQTQVEGVVRQHVRTMIDGKRTMGTASSQYDEGTIDRRIAVLDALPESQQPGTQAERAFLEKARAKYRAKLSAKA